MDEVIRIGLAKTAQKTASAHERFAFERVDSKAFDIVVRFELDLNCDRNRHRFAIV